MTKQKKHPLEQLISRMFAIIDGQIALAAQSGISLPYYDLNEMIKLETEQMTSPLHLSIKFIHENEAYGSECDIHGNYFGLLWMMKHRDKILIRSNKSSDVVTMMQLELYTLWHDDILEMDEIDVNDIATIDAYTKNRGSREITLLEF
ncbi:MAG: hypothetical protein M0R68_10295 [Bacteroidetes bacterium]|nr:hypothetical protein [Bacteroidota bacterium]